MLVLAHHITCLLQTVLSDAGMTSLGPAVQYLAGEMLVEQGSVMPLLASHNTVRMRFDIEQAEYLHLAKPDATFPAMHFSMLADQPRNHVSLSHVDQSQATMWVSHMLISHTTVWVCHTLISHPVRLSHVD